LAAGGVKVATDIWRWIDLFKSGETLPGGFENC
jgi:hypothetical protein